MVEWIQAEVRQLRAGGDRRAAKHVALDMCQRVCLRTGSRRQAEAEYRQTLRIGRAA
jgi:hypothetical protein